MVADGDEIRFVVEPLARLRILDERAVTHSPAGSPTRAKTPLGVAPQPSPPSGSGGDKRGAPGSGQQGADEAEDAARQLGRVTQENVRHRRVRLREVWRQAASAGVRDEAGGMRAILEHLGLPTAGARLAPACEPLQAACC